MILNLGRLDYVEKGDKRMVMNIRRKSNMLSSSDFAYVQSSTRLFLGQSYPVCALFSMVSICGGKTSRRRWNHVGILPLGQIGVAIRFRVVLDVLGGRETVRVAGHNLVIFVLIDTDIVDTHRCGHGGAET